MTYFLDTNVIIDLLNGNSNILANFKNAYVSATVKIPDLVYYEVLRGFEYSDPKNQKVGFEIFANHCGIVYMDKSVLEEAAKQYAYLRKMESRLMTMIYSSALLPLKKNLSSLQIIQSILRI